MPTSEYSPVPAVQGLCNALLGQDYPCSCSSPMLPCWDVYPRPGQRAALLGDGSFWSMALRKDPFLGRPAGRSQAGSLGCRRTGSHLARELNCHTSPLSQPWGTQAAGHAWRRGNPGLQLSCWHCLQALGATGLALQSALTKCIYKNVRSKKKYGHVMASRAQRSN